MLENLPVSPGGGGFKPKQPGKGGKGLLGWLLDKAKNFKDQIKSKNKAKPSLPPLRQQYEDEVRGLANLVDEMYNEGHTIEQIAIKVHQARRDLGIKYKDLTPPDLLKSITERNIRNYNDPLGPTLEWLRSRGKSWGDIIESAVRPGGKDIDFNQ